MFGALFQPYLLIELPAPPADEVPSSAGLADDASCFAALVEITALAEQFEPFVAAPLADSSVTDDLVRPQSGDDDQLVGLDALLYWQDASPDWTTAPPDFDEDIGPTEWLDEPYPEAQADPRDYEYAAGPLATPDDETGETIGASFCEDRVEWVEADPADYECANSPLDDGPLTDDRIGDAVLEGADVTDLEPTQFEFFAAIDADADPDSIGGQLLESLELEPVTDPQDWETVGVPTSTPDDETGQTIGASYLEELDVVVFPDEPSQFECFNDAPDQDDEAPTGQESEQRTEAVDLDPRDYEFAAAGVATPDDETGETVGASWFDETQHAFEAPGSEEFEQLGSPLEDGPPLFSETPAPLLEDEFAPDRAAPDDFEWSFGPLEDTPPDASVPSFAGDDLTVDDAFDGEWLQGAPDQDDEAPVAPALDESASDDVAGDGVEAFEFFGAPAEDDPPPPVPAVLDDLPQIDVDADAPQTVGGPLPDYVAPDPDLISGGTDSFAVDVEIDAGVFEWVSAPAIDAVALPGTIVPSIEFDGVPRRTVFAGPVRQTEFDGPVRVTDFSKATRSEI